MKLKEIDDEKIATLSHNPYVQGIASLLVGGVAGKLAHTIGKKAIIISLSSAMVISFLNHMGYAKIDQDKIKSDLEPFLKENESKIKTFFYDTKEYVSKNVHIAF